MGHLCRTAYLLDGSDDTDNWLKTYFDAFPKDISYLPITYKDKDYLLLYYSMIKNSIDARKNELKSEYDKMIEIPAFSIFSKDDFYYYRAIENMNNMEIEMDYGKEIVFCPIGDNIDYSKTPNSRYYYDAARKSIKFETTQLVKNGDKFTIDYGVISQYRSLMAYGITWPEYRDEAHYFELVQVLKGTQLDET